MAWNVNSLGPPEVQQRVINKVCKSQDNIIVLVDTWLSETQETAFANMWGQKCYFNLLSSNVQGIVVLIKDTLDISEVTWKNEIKGNFSKFAFVHKEQK